jgi:hypothetical protein
MWLKTGINCLYSFGQAAHFSWHVWMHFLLAASVCLMINVKPYISPVDYQVIKLAAIGRRVVSHLCDPAYLVGRATKGLYRVVRS